MRASRRRSPSSRRLTLLFVVVLLPPALALVWLGATLLDQDRAMLARRGHGASRGRGRDRHARAARNR